MLDVHPPHTSAHTWRDFFLHIATIVVGLLIAIGLEQSVEWLHHHRQLSETRELLRLERDHNRKTFAANTALFRVLGAYAQNDLLVLHYLQQHPGTPEEQLPGIVRYDALYEPMDDAAWKTAQRTDVTELMPREEGTEDEELYLYFSKISDAEHQIETAANNAGKFYSLDPNPSHLTPAQIEDQIKLTQDYLTSAINFGLTLENINRDFPDFTPSPTIAELRTLRGEIRTQQDLQKLQPAQQQTAARTNALLASARAATKAAKAK